MAELEEEMMDMPQEPPTEGEDDSPLLSPYDRPFPGQAMVDNNPSYPHNRPPDFVDYEKAQTFIFNQLTARGEEVVSSLHAGVTVEDIAEMLLNAGYIDGKWDHNLLMLLAEPTIYTILFIAEVAGVDYILYDDEVEEMTSPDDQMRVENHLTRITSRAAMKIEEDIEEQGAEDSIESALPASLLEKGGMQDVSI